MWELIDARVREKIARFASDPTQVTWSGSAERDMGSTPGMTKAGVLEGIMDQLSSGYVVHADYMKNGDVAYIFDCFVGDYRRYVKVKFWMIEDQERVHVFSAHSHRRGGRR